MKVHFQNTRLRVNAGISFPECYAGAEMLDLDKTICPTTGDRSKVTCKRCLRKMVRIDRAEMKR